MAASLPIIVASAISYHNALWAGFAYDDSRAIQSNADLKNDRPWTNLFFNDFWGTPLQHSGSHKSYRPLCVLTFRLNHALHDLDPMGYHLANIIVHTLASLLYYALIRRLALSRLAALYAALLFATHPVHVEAVTGVVGRADLLACVFFLLALLAYERGCRTTSATRWGFVGVAVGCCLAAMLSKEQGVTALGVCVIYDVFVVGKCRLANIRSLLVESHYAQLRRRLIVLVLSGVVLLGARVVFMGNKPPSFAPSDNPAADSSSFLTRFLTFSYLPAFNFALLLCPTTLSFDWSMKAIPLVESIADARHFATLTFYASLVVIVDVCVTRFYDYARIARLLGVYCDDSVKTRFSIGPLLVALALLVFPFLPATNALFYVGFVVAERVLYMPSMGYCLALAIGVERVWAVAKEEHKKFLALLCLGLLILFCGRTIRRNNDWQTEEKLYRSGIPINPPKAWGNLANVMKAQNRLDDAEQAYRNALEHRPNMADAHYNLGILLQESGRNTEAIASYKNAVSFRPTLASAHLNLGIVLETVGENVEAEKVLRHCATIPDHGLKDPKAHAHSVTSCLYNLGRLLHKQDRNEESVEIYMRAIRSLPIDYAPQSLYNLLGESYFSLKKFKEAEHWYEKSLASKRDHLPAHLTLAKLYGETNRQDKAEEMYNRAKRLDPRSTEPYVHYGRQSLVSYFLILSLSPAQYLHGRGHLEAAAEQFSTAAELVPDNYEINFNAGNYFREAKVYDKAEKYFKVAVKLKPESANGHMNLGALYHLTKRYDDAERHYEEALRLSPGDQLTMDNLRKLKSAMKTSGRS
ncbi:protein O-mannosyl-transferase TMTC2-like isoform X2 [Oscarella lobularis]|uniref:protein O-mannosyl-transferase TMTC2-like isoform X2 n=1 Tax=Oscarella lobularis TaxID=121494 RepID=UPI003313CBD1